MRKFQISRVVLIPLFFFAKRNSFVIFQGSIPIFYIWNILCISGQNNVPQWNKSHLSREIEHLILLGRRFLFIILRYSPFFAARVLDYFHTEVWSNSRLIMQSCSALLFFITKEFQTIYLHSAPIPLKSHYCFAFEHNNIINGVYT